MKAIRPLLAVLLLSGCTTAIALTDEGSQVRHGTRADMPPGCRLLGEVRIGIPPDAAMPPTEEDLIILMRNKAAEQGGNFVILDSSEQRDANEDGEVFWRGRGTAYECPEQTEPDPLHPETSGGEVDEGGGLEEDEGGDTSSEGDDALDDLLGE